MNRQWLAPSQASARVKRAWLACADDFALSPSVTRAILALMQQGRLTATSAMVDSPDWQAAARDLPEPSAASIGLHLNLTECFGQRAQVLPCASLRSWLARSMARAVDAGELDDSIHRQLDRFEDALGRPPDYIDGHQHVHQLAVVRNRLTRALATRYHEHRPWLRSTRPPAGLGNVKSLIIAGLGDAGLRRCAARSGLRMSSWLVGVYDFQANAESLRSHLQHWMRLGPDGSVLMCHPGMGETDLSDPIAPARKVEFDVLASDWFADALVRQGITLTARPPLAN